MTLMTHRTRLEHPCAVAVMSKQTHQRIVVRGAILPSPKSYPCTVGSPNAGRLHCMDVSYGPENPCTQREYSITPSVALPHPERLSSVKDKSARPDRCLRRLDFLMRGTSWFLFWCQTFGYARYASF